MTKKINKDPLSPLSASTDQHIQCDSSDNRLGLPTDEQLLSASHYHMKSKIPSDSDYNQQKGKGEGREGRQDSVGMKSRSRVQPHREECRQLVDRSALKIAARKAGRLEAGGWRELQSGEYVKPAGGQKGRRGRRQWFIVWNHSYFMLLRCPQMASRPI